jgi:hypothetical protein
MVSELEDWVEDVEGQATQERPLGKLTMPWLT